MPDAAELDQLCVVLVATRNPLNLGAAARAMSNFGFLRLRVVNPYPVAFREARSAVGAADVLAAVEQLDNVAAAVADCALVVGTTAGRDRQPQLPLRRLEPAARLIRRRLRSSRVALLFGSEKRGLSNDDLSHCHWLLRIPTHEQHGSMNLAQAVAVCLYELVRAPGRAREREQVKLASAADLERMTGGLFEILKTSGYVDPPAAASAEQKLRRMVRRLRLPASDAETWLGMLRQIRWKLRSAG